MAFRLNVDDLQEQQRRIDATIARASACHMSDAKWRKLFAVLYDRRIGPLRWKFLRDDRVFTQSAPPPEALFEQRLGDVLPSPGGAYREIEWVEIPSERSTGVVKMLAEVSQFPIVILDSGIRVIGYTW